VKSVASTADDNAEEALGQLPAKLRDKLNPMAADSEK
jgi:hypothetical protein